MFIKRAILKNSNVFNRYDFEETLRLTIGAEYEIKYTDKYIYLEIYDFDDSFSKMNVVSDLLNSDFNTTFTILLVPKFDAFMLKLLDLVNGSGVFNAYQVLNSSLIKGKIKKEEIPLYLENIDNEYYEEIMLKGMIISLDKKCSFDTLEKRLNYFKKMLYSVRKKK